MGIICYILLLAVVVTPSDSTSDDSSTTDRNNTTPVYTCPTSLPYPGYVYEESCYMFVNDYNDLDWYVWYSANQYCKRLNMTLVSIHSDGESSFLTSHMQRAYHNYWIGLTRLDYLQLNKFVWTDGTALDYTRWRYGHHPAPSDITEDHYYDLEEQSHCIAIDPSGNWNIETCFDSVRPWICEMQADLSK